MTHLIFTGLILAAVGLNTIAQVLFKSGAGESLLNFYLIGGVAAYGLSTSIYISILSKFNLYRRLSRCHWPYGGCDNRGGSGVTP